MSDSDSDNETQTKGTTTLQHVIKPAKGGP